MITGFNTDVKHKNRVFHIQTEDKGETNPFVESLVYVGGEILATKRTSYAEVLKTSRHPGPDGAAAPNDDRRDQRGRSTGPTEASRFPKG